MEHHPDRFEVILHSASIFPFRLQTEGRSRAVRRVEAEIHVASRGCTLVTPPFGVERSENVASVSPAISMAAHGPVI